MTRQKITIGEDVYTLTFEEFNDEDVDIDKLLRIDCSNLIGEMVTIPVWIMRFGNLLADAESKVSEKKLNCDVLEAKLKEKYRIELAEENKGKNPTVDQLTNAVLLDKTYQAMKKSYISAQKTAAYLNSIFWSLKDKSSKLNGMFKVSDITTETEVTEGRVNNIMLKKSKKLID